MYDLCVIGSGPAGYSACLSASQNNLKTCLIEKDTLGGVCLNKGCIPTKTLLYSSKIISLCRNAAEFGVNLGSIDLDFGKISLHKNSVVNNLKKQMETFLKFKKVDLLSGEAEIISEHQIKVGNNLIEAKYIILAIGSSPKELPFLKFDGQRIVSSDSLLELENFPANLLIAGAGAIGCEFANIYSSFGSKVTLAEIGDEILPGVDKEISLRLKKALIKRGVEIFTKKDVREIDLNKFDKILVSVGRFANINLPGLNRIGIEATDKIIVNKNLRTPVENIYAVGDCIGAPFLAHAASYEARVAVENIIGSPKEVDYFNIPNCIYTEPQVATVGKNEEELKKQGKKFFVKKFPFSGLGKAQAVAETEGLLKIIFDSDSGMILGAHIVGAEASEIIAPLAVSVSNKLTLAQLKEVVFAHPTLSEIISEALHS